jgi:hypothetical protein
VVTGVGDKHVFRCGSTIEMKRWIITLRDLVDGALLASVLAENDR